MNMQVNWYDDQILRSLCVDGRDMNINHDGGEYV